MTYKNKKIALQFFPASSTFNLIYQRLLLLLILGSVSACHLDSSQSERPASQFVHAPTVHSLSSVDPIVGYCDLTVDLTPEIGQPYEQSRLEDDTAKAVAAIQENKLQEAIWFYSRHRETRHQAETLQLQLRAILEGPYEIIPHQLGGSVNKLLLQFGHGVLGVYKEEGPQASNWNSDAKAEVAAYQLDQLLMLRLVPMTIWRTIEGMNGSIQYFVKDMVQSPGGLAHFKNSRALKFFDYWIKNHDRHEANSLVFPTENLLIAIDNGNGFNHHGCGTAEQILELVHLEPALSRKIQRLHDSQIRNAVHEWLSQEAIDSLLERTHALQHVVSVH